MADKNAEYFDNLKDYANKDQLLKYDDGRLWFYLTPDSICTLGELAHIVHSGDQPGMLRLIHGGYIQVKESIKDIPGDDFMCIYFDDVYFLEDYK